MNKWEKIKEYINRRHLGHVFSRKYMLFLIYNNPKHRTSSYGTTVDNYLRCLRILGIIETIERGKYKIKSHIRDDLSVSELKRVAYGGYRTWFNDVKIEEGDYAIK